MTSVFVTFRPELPLGGGGFGCKQDAKFTKSRFLTHITRTFEKNAKNFWYYAEFRMAASKICTIREIFDKKQKQERPQLPFLFLAKVDLFHSRSNNRQVIR